MSGAREDSRPSRSQAWFEARTTWQRRGLALLAGATALLGFAPFQLALFYSAALVVLVWLLDGVSQSPNRIARAFGCGWLFGLGLFGPGLHWVSSAFLVDAQTWGPYWGVPAAALLAAAMALFWGAGCALAMVLWTRDLRRIAMFAACVFAAEWLRGHLFGGFPWLLPGYVWAPGEPISQAASVFGIYGLSLLTLLLGAAPAAFSDGALGIGRRFAPVVVAALIVGMGWGWGEQRLARAPVDPSGAQPIVRVADSGLSQREKLRHTSDQEWRVLRRYLEASGPAERAQASILIWPEGAIPALNFYVLEHRGFLEALGRGLGDRALIMGLTRYDRQARQFFNSAVVIDGVNGEPKVSPQIYDKNHLVPFSETMPFEALVRSLNIPSLQSIGAYFTPGPPPTRLVVPGAPSAVVLICYEAIFPGMVPRGAERPGWLVSVTNDSWFGGGIGPQQHYAMARYRAIEEGLPMARAASGGVSAIIDSFGREVSSTSGRGLYAEAQIPPALVETTMARFGDVLVLLLFALVAGVRFLPVGRRPQNGSSNGGAGV